MLGKQRARKEKARRLAALLARARSVLSPVGASGEEGELSITNCIIMPEHLNIKPQFQVPVPHVEKKSLCLWVHLAEELVRACCVGGDVTTHRVHRE